MQFDPRRTRRESIHHAASCWRWTHPDQQCRRVFEIAECQDHSIENFDYIIRNNIRFAFLMTKFALLQRSRGLVISTGSEAGDVGEPTAAPYGGSKGFLHAFTR